MPTLSYAHFVLASALDFGFSYLDVYLLCTDFAFLYQSTSSYKWMSEPCIEFLSNRKQI